MSIKLIKQDFQRWCEWKEKPKNTRTFLSLFFSYPEYRRLIDFRLKSCPFYLKLLRIITFFSTLHQNLYMSTESEIKGGLIIQHGFSTMIYCQSMGQNCFINQQVTIGWNKGGVPQIGNNVTIRPGAKVLGSITIGDDVEIGANAVVLKDIPPHSIVVGIPAKIIYRRNKIGEKWQRVY